MGNFYQKSADLTTNVSVSNCDHILCSRLGKLQPLPERLVSLSIMGDRLKGPLKSLDALVLRWLDVFQGDPQYGPNDAERG